MEDINIDWKEFDCNKFDPEPRANVGRFCSCGYKYRGESGWYWADIPKHQAKLETLVKHNLHFVLFPIQKYCYRCPNCVEQLAKHVELKTSTGKKRRKCCKCSRFGHTQKNCYEVVTYQQG